MVPVWEKLFLFEEGPWKKMKNEIGFLERLLTAEKICSPF